jgi:hypothetical protein
MRDRHIRAALVDYLRERDPTAAVLHELPLYRGARRADVACVNGVLAGYEIKSEVDSLARLGGQADEYSRIFEYMTVVIAPQHLRSIRRRIDNRWGIWTVHASGTELAFLQVRQPRRNSRLDKHRLGRLLWKPECLRILRTHGINVARNALISELWDALELLPTQVLCAHVRNALKARGDSVFDRSRTPNGG